ncbi:hypothetical protein K461DRAFT_315990 [Myriangium duriaei CBS 260.36]|uniref:Uncharacterized protein n=1 Tax=Myriangium duriaei CBS 260.36 TaxID=1168546 RepID=A0A9P4IWF2_9PEZI|nr:hypothetical protein K461DRAFT_315990 [Myriangium duriaei CBS 260.36]
MEDPRPRHRRQSLLPAACSFSSTLSSAAAEESLGQVMRIPELVRMILAFIFEDDDTRTLSRTTRVNHLFFDLSIPFLWHGPPFHALDLCSSRRRKLLFAPLIRTLIFHPGAPRLTRHDIVDPDDVELDDSLETLSD